MYVLLASSESINTTDENFDLFILFWNINQGYDIDMVVVEQEIDGSLLLVLYINK